ncbi:MAG: hypothetical protein H7334_09915 [Ferruginibacter sp.]|nr:hypothetical protein [Ferruginibacter sp.]
MYRCVGKGKYNPFFAKFFKVRNRYESFVCAAIMLPVKFLLHEDKGVHKIYKNVTLNQEDATAIIRGKFLNL